MNNRPCFARRAIAAPPLYHPDAARKLRSPTKSGVQTESPHARLNSYGSPTAHCRQDQGRHSNTGLEAIKLPQA
ncbi:hypothetical protein J4729_21770 [Leisingera sp. HS039]|uniref:hypothetical protein n=1 Tax=Leisingera sp. HS039 TaxID=2818496 RepID=UPI001B39DEC9|nr:hypothetical protein [Leisingera sp. HS039]MBQ4827150.1 hypothetical protein [Leisingera sp. HS039]